MPFTLTRALRVLADSLGLSTVRRRAAAAATKAVPPSTQSRRKGVQPSRAVVLEAARQILDQSRQALAAVVSVPEPLEGRALMSTTYYVSPGGNDANSGTSSSAPWKTIAKADGHTFSAGDQLLFQGGQTFDGNLTFSQNDSGTASNPVVVGSYGSGRATISAGTGDGIYAFDTGGLKVQDLVIVGRVSNGNTQQYGVKLEADVGGQQIAPVTVTGCDISGFYAGGILVEGDASNTGYAGTTITNNYLHDNVVTGLYTFAGGSEMLPDVYVAYNTAYDNYGTSAASCTGNGLMLSHVEGALVEHNVATDNGADGYGAVGIWCFSSDHVTFQYNASVDNHTTGVDGDGFDFDADTSNSVMQYNYAADNDGGGFMNDQWYNDADQANNVIRFNVAQDDGRKNGYGELEAWGRVENAQFYNNTVYTSAASGNAAVRVHNYTITNLHATGVYFTDNIFVTTGGADLLNVPASMLSGSSGITFEGNVYYSSGAATRIAWGNSTYSSLAAFQSATGQEQVNGKAVGSSANPLLVAPGSAGQSPTTGTNLAAYTAGYQLQAASPVASAGVSLDAVRGISLSGTYDLYGDPLSAASAVPGADSVKGATAPVVTSPTPTPTPSPTPTTTPTSTPTTTLPTLTGWDIGAFGRAGSNAQSGSTVNMTAGGSDIYTTADSFRYAYTSLTGNGQIVAQVASESDANAWAKAGVMIRNGTGSATTAANAANVSMTLTANGDAQLISRATAGGTAVGTTVSKGSASWVKLVRSGNTFTGYISANGTTWTEVAQTTVAMNSTVTVGLAVTAHDATKTESATFKNVSIAA